MPLTLSLRYLHIDELDLSAYNAVFEESPYSTPFHSLDWLMLIKSMHPHLNLDFAVIVDKETDMELAYFPYFTRQGNPFGMFLPFGGYTGFIFRQHDLQGIKRFLETKKFLKPSAKSVFFHEQLYNQLFYRLNASDHEFSSSEPHQWTTSSYDPILL